jgi:hypothetical protein
MSSDLLAADQIAQLKYADETGHLLHDSDMKRLFRHIEALEGERDRFLAGGLEADNRTLRATRRAEAAEARAERLEGEVERLNAECCRCGQPTTAVCKAARDADARAERLREALQDVVDAYDFVIVDEYDRGWSSVSDAVVAARKAIRAAAGGEG